MKKRILAFALCAFTLVGLAACGGTNDPIDDVPGGNGGDTTGGDFENYGTVNTPIVVWASDAEIDVINDVVKDYNDAQTDASKKFNITTKAVSEADAGTTLSNDPTVTGAPALFLCADDHINNLVTKDIVLKISGTYKERIDENIEDISISAATLDGSLYGFPVTSDNGYFLWYNKKVFTEEDVTSLEKMLEICGKENLSLGFDLENGYYAASPFLSPEACGTDSLKWRRNDQGQIVYDINWDNATGVKVAEYFSNLVKPYSSTGLGLIEGDTAGGNALFAEGFLKGTMAACISGTWMEKDLTAAIGDDLAATKLPAYHIDGKAYQLGSFSGTKVYCINKTRPAAEQKVAAALGDLLSTKEAQLRRYEIRQSIPCNTEALSDARYTDHLTLSAVALQEQNQYSITQSQAAENRYWDVGKALGGSLLRGDLGTAKSWTDYLKQQCDLLRTAQ